MRAELVLLTIYRLMLRLLPIAGGVVGWYEARWIGMFAGLCLGAVLAVAVWMILYTMSAKRRIGRQRREMAELSTERLKEIAADPSNRALGFAMGELKNRGIDARPSLDSVCALLTSAEQGRRVQGMTTLFGLYPEVFAKIGEDASSDDSPEVWRARLAGIREGL